MKRSLFGNRLLKLKRRASLLLATIMTLIVVVIAFYPSTYSASAINVLAMSLKHVASPTQSNVALAASHWQLVWSDEFNGKVGTPPDPTKWSPSIGGGGWGNQQLEYDTNNQNAYQDGNGNMVLEARKGNPEGYRCWYGLCQYTSAHIRTQGHFSFTYGLIEARIKISAGQGLWPAFWLLGANCPKVGLAACGEMDVMENIGRTPNIIQATIHSIGNFRITRAFKLHKGNYSDGFHVFALQWDAGHLYFMMDGVTYFTLNKASLANQKDWVFNHPFFIILNNAVGGHWPGSPVPTTVFPQKMIVSYVRVYQQK